jgi:transcription elongation factor B subunit 1
MSEQSAAMEVEGEKEDYGGCLGPNAQYVNLVSLGRTSLNLFSLELLHCPEQISSDGQQFYVLREHALTSGTIRAMLTGPGEFAENEANEVNFREIPSHVLARICCYFAYKVK